MEDGIVAQVGVLVVVEEIVVLVFDDLGARAVEPVLQPARGIVGLPVDMVVGDGVDQRQGRCPCPCDVELGGQTAMTAAWAAQIGIEAEGQVLDVDQSIASQSMGIRRRGRNVIDKSLPGTYPLRRSDSTVKRPPTPCSDHQITI